MARGSARSVTRKRIIWFTYFLLQLRNLGNLACEPDTALEAFCPRRRNLKDSLDAKTPCGIKKQNKWDFFMQTREKEQVRNGTLAAVRFLFSTTKSVFSLFSFRLYEIGCVWLYRGRFWDLAGWWNHFFVPSRLRVQKWHHRRSTGF